MASLITLSEYKALQGITHTRYDARITAMIPPASQLVLNYTDRDFGVVPGGATVREYFYDGSGVLEIDDATTVTVVAWVGGATLQPADYVVRDQNGVLTYIELPPTPRRASPEMGFERNLDQFPLGYTAYDQKVAVTATYGWRLEEDSTRVPSDVKLALSRLIQNVMEERPDIQGEAIASYSIQYAQLFTEEGSMPSDVMEMLDYYRRETLA